MSEVQWHRVDEAGTIDYPEEGALVKVLTESFVERPLVWEKGLWWLPDRSMYVYFVPVAWRPIEESP